MWSHLNTHDLPADDPAYSEALRRVLGRLGEYTELIVRPLNMRPKGATLLLADDGRVEVRVSSAGGHIVLVTAPDSDMAAEVFWLRALQEKHLPVTRLISHDLSCTTVPFSYALTAFVGGVLLSTIDDEPRMRVAARQLGRTLRRSHQIAAPGFGRPTQTGRWPRQDWRTALEGWLARAGVLEQAQEILGESMLAAVRAATLEHPALECGDARVIHGAVAPSRAIVTTGDAIQLEALVRPGQIVGGDPLFDLAHALLPHHPAAFRQGLTEGYAAVGPLDPAQRQRLRRIGLLVLLADTLQRDDSGLLARLPALISTELAALEP